MHWKDDGARIGQSLFCPAEWTEISESLELTQRESEVVLAVLGHRSDSDIAEELEI